MGYACYSLKSQTTFEKSKMSMVNVSVWEQIACQIWGEGERDPTRQIGDG